MSSFSLLSLILATTLLYFPTSTTAASYYDQYSQQQQQQQSSSAYDVFSARRERNLDHWDADTAAAYLGLTRTDGGDEFTPLPPEDDVYAGHDAAILFYAQWCQNCHALAPNYDAIGTLMEAGTARSNLILALFDCERDADHMALCRAVGIQAYPTIMFVGSGPYHDSDPLTAKFAVGKSKQAGVGSVPTELKRAVQFAGDWRYAEQVMDWIKCMRGLSRWHRLNTEGWLSVLRRGIFGLLRKPPMNSKAKTLANSLPVGIPPKLVEARRSSGTGGGSSQMSTAETAALQKQVKGLENQVTSANELLETSNEAIMHASYTIDSILLPTTPAEGELGADCVVESSYPPYVDVYAALKKSDGWDATADSGSTTASADGDAASTGADGTAGATSELSDEYILRSCVVDLSLDYCTRVSTRVTTDYLDELEKIPEAEYPKLSDLDALLANRTDEVEPYCTAFTECYVEEFKEESCRPISCPFKNEVACRYAANCLDARIKEEYKEALTSIGETAEQRAAAAATNANAGSSSGAWGVV
mmetsp:Transcript_6390/g.15346  ORF Transcript_6390/g.15346 Transcript_6390/m.15346 type:complete len:533 (-) Transcript_6390:63-1661(-)